MTIRPEEYGQMDWDIYSVPLAKSVLKEFPDLETIFKEFLKKEMPKGFTLDKMIRYIIYVYHKKSPLVKRISDIDSRKDRALMELGFMRDDAWDKEFVDIMNNESDLQVDMIFQFLYYQRDINFLSLITQEESYMNFSKSLMKLEKGAAGIEKQTKISAQLDIILTRIEKYSTAAFYGDISLKDDLSVQKLVASRAAPVSPEENAANEKDLRSRAKAEAARNR